jgi:hypothetical protein
MSLINDALRRASQSDKDRPLRASSPLGMQPTPAARNSRLTLILTGAVLVALLMACWFFWQWWIVRNNFGGAVEVVKVAPVVTRQVIPTPQVIPPAQVVPKIAPVVVPVAPVNPAPAPVVIPATPVVAAPVAVPAVAPPPTAANDSQTVWPVELKLSAIFFSKNNPKVLINGDIHKTGDQIQGVVLKSIEQNQVTVEWNGQSKILMIGGQ